MMSKIEFSVEINPEKKKVALAAVSLIAAIAELSVDDLIEDLTFPRIPLEDIEVEDPKEVKLDKVEEIPAVEEKPKKKNRKSTKKVEPEIEETREEEEKPAKAEKASEKASKPTKGSEPSVSIEDIRRVLKDVVRDNREAILAKLQEFEASSASTLDEEHYGEFYEYIIELRDE